MGILTCEEMVARLVAEAEALGLEITCKRTDLELETLCRVIDLHLVPAEWPVRRPERRVRLELTYAADQAYASNPDLDIRVSRRQATVHVTAVFRLVVGADTPLESLEERTQPPLRALSAAFPQKKLWVNYSVATNYQDPPQVRGAEVNVPFTLDIRANFFDVEFLEQVACALRAMGPSARSC